MYLLSPFREIYSLSDVSAVLEGSLIEGFLLFGFKRWNSLYGELGYIFEG